MQVLVDVDQYVGKYFSTDWIKKNVLRFTEEEIEEIQKEMDSESEEEAERQPLPGEEEEEEQQQQYVLKPAPAQKPAAPKPSAPAPQQKNEEIELTEAMTNFLNKMSDEY